MDLIDLYTYESIFFTIFETPSFIRGFQMTSEMVIPKDYYDEGEIWIGFLIPKMMNVYTRYPKTYIDAF